MVEKRLKQTGTSHEWGTVTEYIYIGSWLTEGMAADIRSITTTSNLDTEGDYFYAVEGGNVSGTYREESYGYDYSYTNISLQLNDGTWNSTGFHLASSNGHSESGYGGCGYYYIDETSMEGDYLDVVDIDGYIEESGASNENYWYLTTGILTSAGWSMLGSGFSHSYNETYYLNGESGVLISGIYVSKFTSQCRTDDTIHYLDRYSVNRDTGWALVNGVWTATSGIETEKGYTEDNAKSETNGKYVEAGEEPGSKYYELSDSQSTDDYWLDRTIIAGMWKATAGESISGIDGKYQKDVMIESEKYERELTGGTMAGTLGTIRRDREEYQYESQSTIDNADWLLQSGTGFYRNDISFGDFAEGEGEYTVDGTHKGQSWSYSGNVEESWKDLSGGGERNDYEVTDHQWQIKDEWETETNFFEYKSCDQAEGTKAKNIAVDLSTTSSNFSIGFGTTHEDHVDHIFLTTPPTLINFSVASMNEVSDYNMERRYEITDETEVRTKWDDNGKLKTKGTRHIAEIDDFFESFESEKSHSVSASGTTHFGTISGTEIIDNYFERYSDDEWLFEHESDSLYKEEYKSTIEEYQEKNLNKTIDFDAEQYFFSGSEDSCSKIDNTTKSKITYEFESQNSDSDNEVTRTASITEETEKDHYSYYDFTNTIDFSDSYNEDKIRCISSEYSISEEKTTTGEGYKEFTALATKDFNDRWNAGSKLLQEQWTTEEIDASGTRTDEVNYVGTNPYPSDLNCQYSDLIEWNLTSFYNENYGYVRKADSRSNSYSAIENHVTGSMDADGQTSAILCFCHYHDIETTARGDTAITASTGKRHNDCDCGDVYNGTPEPKDNYDKTVTYAGFYYAEFYTGGYSYSRPSQSLPTLGNSNRMMTAEEASWIDKNYATWAALNLPGSSITVGERNFSRFANYFAEYGFQGLEGDDYDDIVGKLANLSSNNSFYVNTTNIGSQVDKIIEEEYNIIAVEDTIPGFDYEEMFEKFFTKYGEEGVSLLLVALKEGYSITKAEYSNSAYLYHPAWWIEGKTINIGNTHWLGNYRTAEDAADRLMYALDKVYEIKFGMSYTAQKTQDRERQIYDCLLGSDYANQAWYSRYYRFNAAWMLNSWIGNGILKIENAITGKTILDESLSTKQRLLGGAIGTGETFLLVVPVAKGITGVGAASARALGVASIAETTTGKFLMADLTFKVGENIMKQLCNTSAGQAFLKTYDKIYQSKYNVTIFGAKKTPIGNVGIMPKEYVRTDGKLNWPNKPPVVDGFTDGTRYAETLQPGMIIDRYGKKSGSYASPENVPFAERALPPGTLWDEYHRYKVLKPLEVEAGTAAPWFNQPGGGVQYKLPNTIQYLLDNGYIIEI